MSVAPASGRRPRALLVDLNNFARYPTLSIGYLAAILRRSGVEVDVFSPLSVGVSGVEREPRARAWSRLDHFARHLTASSSSAGVQAARSALVALRHPLARRRGARLADELQRSLEGGYEVIFASAYLMYREAIEGLAARCQARGLPLLVGGPYFAQPEVLDSWRSVPGVSGVFAGEGEEHVVELLKWAVGGPREPAPLGVSTSSGRGRVLPPLRELDRLPFPDYSDFPWDRYPNRIVPVVTARGCGWGECMFCSDVTSSAGRTFRTRSVQNVLDELAHQAERCSAALFAFTDLKLNSHLPMWHGLVEGVRRAVPGCQWIGSVHVDDRNDNGLDRESLKAAAASGMVRLTTGLESGSQRMLDRMHKGTNVDRIEAMLRAASEAGISVRVTMIVGYPGEEPADVQRSASFLERNRDAIDRVLLNRFALITGTRVQRRMAAGLEPGQPLDGVEHDTTAATVRHRYAPARSHAYRRELWRLLGATHAINRRPLALPATAFEGVM
jgi:anaerobic magnesium-protoporphyrin IX monomethyl ester cyclase